MRWRTHNGRIMMALIVTAVAVAITCILSRLIAQEAELPLTGSFPSREVEAKHTKCPIGSFHIARLRLRESTLRVDPMSDINLLTAIRQRTRLNICPKRFIVTLGDDEIFNHPFVIFVGEHVPMRLNQSEAGRLRRYLLGGGFLYVDECPAKLSLREPLRGELQRLLPEYKLERLSLSHPLYNSFYRIVRIPIAGKGGANYHEGISVNGRLVIVYSTNGEGCSWQSWKWAGPLCACLPPPFDYAFEFGINLVYYAMTH
ncbi:MAG: DUF4159 domain-containing protein [Armatimonadota bacterium]|nr:DUF4159 domain-containing protein [Armatimonadota bacterium]MCX7776711.1 DUF4159 domain-containing protein [Armatimonadota bacterium]MDW8025779.1 DUF4159 domain-containing protein [Armatimonadota bacterium]